MYTLTFPELQKQLIDFIDTVYDIEKMKRKAETIERLKQKLLRNPTPSEVEQEIQRIKQIGV
jgi:hypothetical protein